MRIKTRFSAVALVACLALLGGALLAGSADAKKKKKKPSVATLSATPNAAIPDRAAGASAPLGLLSQSLTVGKKFKGKTVGDIALTYQTTGSAADAANDLGFYLTAPNGRSYEIDYFYAGQSIGPITLAENSTVRACPQFDFPDCTGPFESLKPPYAGTAQGFDLPKFNGSPIMGTWTLTVLDFTNTKTSTLNLWKLVLTAQKPVK
jgi:hypothetical protein